MSQRQEKTIQQLHSGTSALELAEVFISLMSSPDYEEVDRHRQAVMLAAEYIAETAGPAQWRAFDAEGFFPRIDFMAPRDQHGLALALMGFYGWLVFEGLLEPKVGLEIMSAIAGRFPTSALLNDFLQSTKPLLLESISTIN